MAVPDEVSPISPADGQTTRSMWTRRVSRQEEPQWGNINNSVQQDIRYMKPSLEKKPINRKPVPNMPPLPIISKEASDEETAEVLIVRRELPPGQWRCMFVVLMVLSLMNGYDLSNTANIQATIYEAMGHIEIFSWITLGYCVGIAATVPLARRLSEIGDLRTWIIIWTIVFAVGVAVVGSATNIQAVIAGRALNGVGAAGATQLSFCYITLFSKPEHVPISQGLTGMALALGLFIGPLIGSGFADNDHTTWRWAYYVMLPFLGVLFPIYIFIFPSFNARSLTQKSLSTSLYEIDWIGAILHAGTFTLLPVALTLSGSVFAWNSAGAISLWVFAGLFLVAYVVQQAFCVFTTPSRRIFPGHLVLNRAVGLANLGAACAALAYSVGLYYLPVFFSLTRGHGPIATAVRFLPFIGVFIISTLLSSVLLTIIGRYKILYMVAGPLILTAGALITTQMTPSLSESELMGFEALLGLGVGLVFSHAMSISSVTLPADEVFAAACLSSLSLLGTICLGVGIEGSIFQNEGMRLLKQAIGDRGFSDKELREALGGVASSLFAESDPETRALVSEAVTKTVKAPFHLVVAAGATCTLMSLAMKWEKLDLRKGRKKEEDIQQVEQIDRIERDSLDMGEEV